MTIEDVQLYIEYILPTFYKIQNITILQTFPRWGEG